MVYILGNNEWDYIEQVDDAIDDDIDRALFVGGVLYSHAYKAHHPDTEVEAVEQDRMTAFFQEFVADEIQKGRDASEILQNTFLAAKSDRAMPENWERPAPSALLVPQEDIEAIHGEYEDFVERNDRYTREDLAAITGENPIENVFGRFEPVDEDEYSGDQQKHTVDLYEIEHQRHTYLDLVDEIGEVAEPDNIHVQDISEAEDDADLIYTNNVIDWFDSPEQFFTAVDRAGSDDGYYLELYTTGTGYGAEVFDDPEEIRDIAEQATGRTAEIIETDAEGNVYETQPDGDTETRFGTYNTHPIKDGDNHVLLYLE
ncbi:MAG: hypothetical protein SVU32_05140 [Candidatus Nanohaloarchaea archaeon]|nr:hypothetical protein [Candidatus Nanohaloarchaea archaeon]